MTSTVMPVEVQVASELAVLPDEAEVMRWAAGALDPSAHDATVCVRLVDDDESRALNARYRGQDRSTNVLSFDAQVDLPGETVLGDIVICAPVVAAEAQAQGKTVREHLAHMVVHGMLHLQGYDHEDAQTARAMESLEAIVLSEFDIANPYE